MINRVKTVTIKSFRQIGDLRLDLHPRFTTLIGLNGSGKSSILAAINDRQCDVTYHSVGLSLVIDPPRAVDRLIADHEASDRLSAGDMSLDEDELSLFDPTEMKHLWLLLRRDGALASDMADIFASIIGTDTQQVLEVQAPADAGAPIIVHVWRGDIAHPLHRTSKGTREVAILSVIIAFRKALTDHEHREEKARLAQADRSSARQAGRLREGYSFGPSFSRRRRTDGIGLSGLGRSRITRQPGLLLLDEPGSTLHPGAQRRLLGYLQRHAEHQQIVLATHSPFLIDLEFDGGAGVRAVEMEQGHVRARPLDQARDHRTLLPWHEAVGLDMTRRILLEQPTLLVEGNSDRHYLRAMSGFCGAALRPGTGLVQGGGTRRMVLTVSTLTSFDHARGRGSELVVLLDSDTNNADAAEIRKMADRVIRCGDYARDTGSRERNLGEIEDLFEPEEYLRLFLRRYPHLGPVVPYFSGRPPQERHIRCQRKTLPKAITEMLEQMGDPLAGTNFHAEVSQQLMDDPNLLAELGISEATKQRFAHLIEAVNQQVDEIRASREQ